MYAVCCRRHDTDNVQDDKSELDIEIVTKGNSIVNDTINYTTQPSLNPDGSRISGATLSIPLTDKMNSYRTHRFDCNVEHGVKYYLDGTIVHTENHNVPTASGSLQLKLWADGNKYWSGEPSRTDTHLKVKTILAYYNTSTSLTDRVWMDRCGREKRQCAADLNLGLNSSRHQEGCAARRGMWCKRGRSRASSVGCNLQPNTMVYGSMLALAVLLRSAVLEAA